MTSVPRETHLKYLRQTVALAQQSPPRPTNFRVGCVIVAFGSDDIEGKVLSTGFTLELEGNTHAEQCAIRKLLDQHKLSLEEELNSVLAGSLNTTLYTSLEPCSKRLSGNTPCVQRIINTRLKDSASGIQRVIFGAKEPDTFVQDSQSCNFLSSAGVYWEYIPDFEELILSVAMEGHKERSSGQQKSDSLDESVQQDVKRETLEAADQLEAQKEREERQQAENRPRNRFKRMMEAPPGSEAAES